MNTSQRNTDSSADGSSYILMRGPILVVCATTVLLYPVFVSASPVMIGTLVCMLMGISLTVIDVYNKVVSSIREVNREIVLDDVLRNIFSFADGGILASSVGSFVGGISLYNLPISREQRAQLIQSFLPQNINAHDILHTPGGLWNLFPDIWQTAIRGKSDQQSSSLHETSQDLTCNDDIDEHSSHIEANNMTDLVWNDDFIETDNSDLGECSDSYFDQSTEVVTEQEQEQEHSIQMRNLHHFKHQTSLKSKKKTKETSQSHFQSFNYSTNDPSKVVTSIASDVLNTVGEKFFHSIDEKQIERIGIVSSLALAIQFSRSRRTRIILLYLAEGSLALGLGSIAFASIATLIAGRTFMDRQNDKSVRHSSYSDLPLSRNTRLQSLINFIKGTAGTRIKGLAAILVMTIFGFKSSNRRTRPRRY